MNLVYECIPSFNYYYKCFNKKLFENKNQCVFYLFFIKMYYLISFYGGNCGSWHILETILSPNYSHFIYSILHTFLWKFERIEPAFRGLRAQICNY